MRILVSACLLGKACRYDGDHNLEADLRAALRGHEVIAVCPEVAGGLPTPRKPSERLGDRVVMNDGTDVTDNFTRGAQLSLAKAGDKPVDLAILKARSPSCGPDRIYDGTFTKTLTDGDGVFAELLKERGIPVCTEENWREALI